MTEPLSNEQVTPETVLYIDRSDSECGACRRSANPYDVRHETPCGYDKHPGCGALFTAVSTHYMGAENSVRALRPDLPFIDFMTTLGGTDE